MNEAAQARKRLAELEADPKHGPSDKGKAQTKVDRLDDPAFLKPHKLDSRWTTGADGKPYHPEYES